MKVLAEKQYFNILSVWFQSLLKQNFEKVKMFSICHFFVIKFKLKKDWKLQSYR